MSTRSITTCPFSLAREKGGEPGTCLLYSGGEHELARRSSLWIDPSERIDTFPAERGDWVGCVTFEGAPRFFRARERRTFRGAAPPPSGEPVELSLLGLSDSRESYIEKVEQIQELIREGEIYQLCLSQQLQFEGKFDPFDLFLRLAQRAPAPFMAYLNMGEEVILSASPELLLSRRGSQVESRPIKGTAPADSPVERLLSSEKDRAELAMITDLVRSDLGRLCEIGSIRVPERVRCESFVNVHQLLSVVQGEFSGDSSRLLEALLPAGSISGCPKRRALEIIREIEGRDRGIYTGSIGYLLEGGDCCFNVAIRTLSCREDRITLQLGGAITLDSDPVAEWEETLHKGAAILGALDEHRLLERLFSAAA